MIAYFADRKLTVLGLASTELPDGLFLYGDKKVEDIDSGVATFEGNVAYTEEQHLKVKELLTVGNFVLRKKDSGCEVYTILETEDDHESGRMNFYAEDAGLDLLNEIVEPYEATEAKTAEFYINQFTNGSGFEIGLNEISSQSRKLKWDGSSTAAERVRSVATQFEAEIGYRFVVEQFSIKHKYIDIYKKRGKEIGLELRYGREVRNVIEKQSIQGLRTCLRVTGGTPEGADQKPITLKNVSGLTYYDDGDFYTEKSTGLVKSRNALSKWSRFLSESGSGDGHIVGEYSYDTTDHATLQTKAINELKKVCKPEINYEVDMNYIPNDMVIGDTVNIVDDFGEVYVSARVLKIEESASDDQRTVTFGNFLQKESGISATVAKLASDFAEIAKNRNYYTWIAYADDASGTGISKVSTNKEYVGIAVNRTTVSDDTLDPSVYQWTLIKGADGEDGEPGAIGIDGISNYIHIRYSNDGTTFTANDGTTPGDWIGTAVTTSNIAPSSFNDYAPWYKIKGEQGPQGSQGIKGDSGDTYYFHIKYSSIPNPTLPAHMSDNPDEYIGTCVTTSPTAPTTPSSYEPWSRFRGLQGAKGDQGIPGVKGDTGDTYYWHIKYSNDGGASFTSNSGETPGAYIGTLIDQNPTDSLTPGDYIPWVRLLGEKGDKGDKGNKGDKGDTGNSITGVTEYYKAHNNSGSAPTSGWVTDPTNAAAQMTESLRYLWNYEVIHFTDSSLDYSTDPAMIGVYGNTGGAGRGITGVENWYLATDRSSGVTKTDPNWTTAIQTVSAANPYLWNYEVVSYTTGSPSSTDPCIIGHFGADGQKGDKGDKGDTGDKGDAGRNGADHNLLMDVYASSLTKVDGPANRYLSDSGNSTTTGQFIAEANLPDPNATHFYRISATQAGKARGLCWYESANPPILDGSTYRMGCYARASSGSPKMKLRFSTNNANQKYFTVSNTDWQWFEYTAVFEDSGSTSYTYKRTYFYCDPQAAGDALDMCGFRLERVTDDVLAIKLTADTAKADAATAQSTADAANTLAQAAKDSADGKITTFYQNTAPTAVAVGDLWINTANNQNALSRWDGTAWVAVDNAKLEQALQNAATAQATADGKIMTFAQNDAPTGTLDTGDLWVDTDDNNRLYRWNGTTWDEVTDKTNLVPNLTPWFDRPFSDVYNSTTNPNGYWSSITLTSALTQLPDGWAHVDVTNSGTSNALLMRAVGRAVNGIVTGGNYTCLVEFRNVVNAAGINSIYTQQANGVQFWGDSSYDGWTIPAVQIVEGAKIYRSMKCVTGPTKSDNLRWLMSIASYIKPSQTVSYDFRVSLYEGTYTGPYKPYVDQELRADVDAAQTVANNAQTTADRKKQTFITTPTTPYYVGDIYFVDSKLLVCHTERLTGSYTADDWSEDLGYASANTVSDLENRTTSALDTITNEAIAKYKIYDDKLEGIEGRFNSKVQQTSENFLIQFDGLLRSLNALSNETRKKFADYSKYFRFTAEGLEIGEEKNALSLVLDNDKISFRRNGVEFSYWDGSDNSFHVGDIIVDVNQVARFGSFGLVPLEGGDLAWKWLGGST